MAPLTTTRTLFELRVGSSHTVEVLLQIRPSDIPWWNSDLPSHERQLHGLIGRRVLPAECREEIEADRARIREAAAAAAARAADKPSTKKKKGDAVVGSANLKKRAEVGKGEKKKRGAAARRGGANDSKASKKQKKKSDTEAKDGSTSEPKEKRLKLLREPGKWVMGKSIQIYLPLPN